MRSVRTRDITLYDLLKTIQLLCSKRCTYVLSKMYFSSSFKNVYRTNWYLIWPNHKSKASTFLENLSVRIMRSNILIRQLNSYTITLRFISKFREHTINLFFKQPKSVLKIKAKTKVKVKKIMAEKLPLIAQIQCSLS